MIWLYDLAYFAGGMFLVNAVPHFVHGVSGKPFQSPFARPRRIAQSSSVVNMAWALVNLVIAWLLLARVGSFDLRDLGDALSLGIGVAFIGLFLAYHFGRHNGGNSPAKSS